MASRASSSSLWSPPRMDWPTQPPICCKGATADFPRIRRQRARFLGSMAMGYLQVVEIELIQVAQGFLFGLGQLGFNRFAGGIGGDAPVLGEIFGDLSLLAG